MVGTAPPSHQPPRDEAAGRNAPKAAPENPLAALGNLRPTSSMPVASRPISALTTTLSKVSMKMPQNPRICTLPPKTKKSRKASRRTSDGVMRRPGNRRKASSAKTAVRTNVLAT